jgi:hypothetical protein
MDSSDSKNLYGFLNFKDEQGLHSIMVYYRSWQSLLQQV